MASTPVNERKYLGEVIGVAIEMEVLGVPNTGIANRYFIATLREVPGKRPEVARNLVLSRNSDFSNPLRQVSGRLPLEGEYAIEGQDIYFHRSMAGVAVYANYIGVGSIVRAEHVTNIEAAVVTIDARLAAIESGGSGGLSGTDGELLKLMSRDNFGGL